jgi:hypothetical protein
MKVMTALIYIFLGIFSFSQTQAKTILISDIDDTIKNSHVLDKSDATFGAIYVENLVLGMNLVYDAMKDKDPSIKIFYVTNALKSIMEVSHRKFLALNKFPAGSVRLRESLFQKDFKITEIRKILEVEHPDTVILTGDNGERDVFVYEQMKMEHPEIRFLTYIHIAYSQLSPEERGSVLLPGQVGFVTSLDLILQLRNEGFVSKLYTDVFIKFFTQAFAGDSGMADNGPVAMPFWSDCSDFIWTASDEDLVSSLTYLAAKNRIFKRCEIFQ